MKTTISIILVLVCLAFIAGISIQFNPFKISFTAIPRMVGVLFLVLSLICFKYQWQKDWNDELKSKIQEIENQK